MIDTKTLYSTIVEAFKAVLPTYFEDADMPSAALYCVFNSPVHTDIADRQADNVFFYVDIYGDDRMPYNNERLQQACDALRNTLDGTIISAEGHFGGHLNFEKNLSLQETDYDINHRRQEWTARVFYN